MTTTTTELRELRVEELELVSGGLIQFSFFSLDFAFDGDVGVVKDHSTGDVFLFLP